MADISALPILHNIDAGNAPQLARILRGKIESGEYCQGDILPAADIAHGYNVSIRIPTAHSRCWRRTDTSADPGPARPTVSSGRR
jgi:hypothetical protein